MATETKLVTYDDYRNLPDDGKRYEIIGGELFMTPAPFTEHQRILRKLLTTLSSYVEKHQLGEVFFAPIDVVLSMTDVVQPDLVFISDERSQIITKKNIVAAPDLIAEILSESTAKIYQSHKKDLYKNYGVKEYWIIDPDEKKVDQYILLDERFYLKGQLTAADTLSSDVIGGLSFSVEEIFTA